MKVSAKPIPSCSSCGLTNDRLPQRYCSGCHAVYQREWRKTHPLSKAAKARDLARSYASEYKKRGKLEQKPCCVCNSPKSQMHHPDHELPLLVVWMCRECHLTWHAFWRLMSLRTWNRWLENAKHQGKPAGIIAFPKSAQRGSRK